MHARIEDFCTYQPKNCTKVYFNASNKYIIKEKDKIVHGNDEVADE